MINSYKIIINSIAIYKTMLELYDYQYLLTSSEVLKTSEAEPNILSLICQYTNTEHHSSTMNYIIIAGLSFGYSGALYGYSIQPKDYATAALANWIDVSYVNPTSNAIFTRFMCADLYGSLLGGAVGYLLESPASRLHSFLCEIIE